MTVGQESRSGSRSSKDSQVVQAVLAQIDSAESSTISIKEKWTENYDMFVKGSTFKGKAAWQSQFSVPKLSSSIRQAQGQLVNILLQNPKWWQLEARADRNALAEELKEPLWKMVNFFLEDANFYRHAGTFILNSLISIGSTYVGWRKKVIQNPEYVMMKAAEEERREKQRLAKVVENPDIEDEFTDPDFIQESIEKALEDLPSILAGEVPTQAPQPKPYIQVGALDLQDPNQELLWWDTSSVYMEDCKWKAFAIEKPLYEVRQLAKLGFFPKRKVASIPPGEVDSTAAIRDWRYKNEVKQSNRDKNVELLFYYGPLIIDDEVVKDDFFCVIANRSILLKSGAYPYWEPPGQKTPLVNAAVRQIPGRATGAGIGDAAVLLQRTLDSNYQLVCDQFRFALPGLNIINWNSLVDKGSVTEGLEPGKWIEVRDDPNKAFKHEDLSSNIENQVHPIQDVLRAAIDDATGVNDLMTGGGNLRSRTTAAETNAKMSGSQNAVNIIALDLEQNFLIPVLQKVFARVLQFGLNELQNNPQLQSLFSEAELMSLNNLSATDRMDILNNFYRFKVNGFSSTGNKEEKLRIVNEMFQIANSGGPLSQFINMPNLIKYWARLQEVDDENALLVSDSPAEQVYNENAVLLAGHGVATSPDDDDMVHMQLHQQAAQSPAATQELAQHLQDHQMQAQQKQTMGQMPGQPPAGPQPIQ
jgi:hypothetical protein